MKKVLYFALILLCFSCNGKKVDTPEGEGQGQDNDTTLYGICGEGSTMHTLQLIEANNDSLYIHIDDETDEPTIEMGSMNVGDRMAVTARPDEYGTLVAQRIINITSLLGHWNSVDRDFDITEDGEVIPYEENSEETWTTWRILNGQLLLNADTFYIVQLTADSLGIENQHGIYAFQRIHADGLGIAEEEDSTLVE